jgi:hypothetical protein
MRKLLALFILLATPFVSWAEVKIDPKNHIPNQKPGRCAWCTFETLGRTHGWKVLEGLVEKNARQATDTDMINELDKYGIKYKLFKNNDREDFYWLAYQETEKSPTQWLGAKRTKEDADNFIKSQKKFGFYWAEKHSHWKTEFLIQSVKDNLGAAVSLDWYDDVHKASRHMVVLVDITNDRVKFVDSNRPPGEISERPLIWFLERWTGLAITLEKNK